MELDKIVHVVIVTIIRRKNVSGNKNLKCYLSSKKPTVEFHTESDICDILAQELA